jgi:SAM-dependent methyltransferase
VDACGPNDGTTGGRIELRETFGIDPFLYDRARPGYPAALFDDLATLGELARGSRVFEIGVGTGQATRPLAERGYRIVGVELSASLADVARGRLARFGGSVEIIVAPFERWPLPPDRFDAVVAATSFHWLDPATRFQRSADALRAGGILATIATHHVAGGDQAFFDEVQRCYERWDPSTPPDLRLSPAHEIPAQDGDLETSGRFEPAVFRRYEWDRMYSTAEYLDVLRTYSGHRGLGDETMESLLACIGALIDRDHGGSITKRYMNELRIAKRRP